MSEIAQAGHKGRKCQLGSWQPAPVAPRRLNDRVHVWSVSLMLREEQLSELYSLLSPDEQDRAQRFRFDCHQRRFIVARSSLRQILGRYTGEAPHALVFGSGHYGKPFLADDSVVPGLEFNLSHSGEIALVACALDRRVGVDVEEIRMLADAETIAKQYFSPGEYARLMALHEKARRRNYSHSLGFPIRHTSGRCMHLSRPRAMSPHWHARAIRKESMAIGLSCLAASDF